VAGAAAGVPIPKLPGGGGGAAASEGTTAAEAEQLAKRKATLDRQMAVRQETMRNLRRNLTTLRGELERADEATQDSVDAVLAKIQALLKAYDTLLPQ
jgi:hypothetical protein